jgi:DNA polymerase-4
MSTSSRALVLVDVDAMFAACAILERPELRGLPLIVAGSPEDRRSIVLTASYEARARGVRTAMPLRQALRLCPEATVVPPQRALYRRLSDALVSLLRRFTPLVERQSIDECLLDLTGTPLLTAEGFWGSLVRLRRTIGEELGLPVSVGGTRWTAKMASLLAKGHPDGVVVLAPADLPRLVYPLPVDRCHGVGSKTAARLRGQGLRRAGDVARLPEEAARGRGQGVYRLWLELHGAGDDRVFATASVARSLSHEVTFPTDVAAPEELLPVLAALADKVALRMRREHLAARTVTLRLRDARFRDHRRSHTLAEAVTDTARIEAVAKELLTAMPAGALPCRLVAVAVTNLVPEGALPPSLFPDPGADRRRALWQAADALRARYGPASLRPLASFGALADPLYGGDAEDEG